MNKRICFSAATGKIFEINEDEIPQLEVNQLLLVSRPDVKCKKCFGRFHVGKNLTSGSYTICPKCAILCLDFSSLSERFGAKKTPKVEEQKA